MKREIFDLYQTHTLLDSETVGVKTDSEVPFDLGRGAWLRASWWFVKKHWFHLTLKVVIACFLFHMLVVVFDILKDQKKLVSMLGGGMYVEGVEEPSLKKTVVSSGSQSVPDISNDIEFDNFDDFGEIIERPLPITRTILNGVVIENGLSKEIGSLTVEGLRIKDITARYGVTYEPATDYYARLLDEPFALARWMRYQQKFGVIRSTEESF